MFDFIRNLTKSEAEKRQEMLTAYLDGALTPDETVAFEEMLRSDSTLQASLEAQRLVKQNIGQLPQQRAPRNFTLDPAKYGRPAPQRAIQLYPYMRAATALAAIMVIFLFSLELFSPAGGRDTAVEAPIAASNTANDEDAGAAEMAEPLAGEAASDPDAVQQDAPEPEIALVEPATETESVEEQAEVPVEEEAADEVEEEMAAEPAAGEAAAGEAAAEEEAAEEAAVEEAPPVEGEAYPDAAFDAGEETADEAPEEAPDAAPTASPAAESGDGATFGFGTTITQTERNIVTAEPEIESELIGATPSVSAETYGVNQTDAAPDVAPRRLLQTGVGILFLALLAATWLLRRQL